MAASGRRPLTRGYRRIFPKSYAERKSECYQHVARNKAAQVSRNVANQRLAFCITLLPNRGRLATGNVTVMLLGYARVSKSEDQETAPQTRALKQAGCKKIFEE